MPAASFERKGFQTRYSVLVVMGAMSPLASPVVVVGVSMEMRFSP